MDARKQAQELAGMGRYGDTMLMHVNPKEVEGLASIMPITINPETGQPEAFIGAILGSLLGSTIFPNLLNMGMVGAAGGAALGSGLGTYAETGDLEKGIASAVLGYGTGAILGDVAGSGLVEAEIGTETATALQQAGQQVSSEAMRNAALDASLTGQTLTPEALTLIGQNKAQAFIDAGILPNQQVANIADVAAQNAEDKFMNMTTGERMGNMGSNLFSANTVDAIADNYLPIALGGGSLGAQNAQDQYEQEMAEYRANKDKRKQELYAKYPEQIHKRNPYYGAFGVAEGGQIPSYAEGETVYGVGSEGQYRPSNTYMPGFDSEFNFFPNRVIPASAISAREAAKGTSQQDIAPNPMTSNYQPMVLPDYDYDNVPAGSVLGRVQDVYNAGLPTTTQLLSPFRNVGLDTVTEGAGRTFTNYGGTGTQTETGTQTGTGTTTKTETGYTNDDQTYDTGSGKTNNTDSDQTNNSNSEVIDNNDGTSTVVYEDGTTTTVSNESYSKTVTVDSNTDRETGEQLQSDDEGYVSEDSEDYSQTTYAFGSGGGRSGMNPYLGSAATTYDQVQENQESVKEAARGQGELDAKNAAVAAGIDPTRIVYGADYNNNTVYAVDDPETENIDESSVIVTSTGYRLGNGTFVYTNTDPLLGNVEDGDNFFPGERRQASAGILIRPDGTIEQINDLGAFTNPGDGSVIELNNGYTVVNDPDNGINNYGGVGMFAESPDMGVAYEKDPAIRSPDFVYKTLSKEQRNAAAANYDQAISDSMARGDTPSAQYDADRVAQYAAYLAELAGKEEADKKAKEEEEAKKEEEEKKKEEEEKEKEDQKYVKSDPADDTPAYTSLMSQMAEGRDVPNMQQPMQNPLEQEVIQAVLGSHPNPDSVIQAFIQQFGVDAFLQLRDQVLKQQVPNAQTEGMIEGIGGGMDDLVMGKIGNQSPVAVSPGEYIIPADVVSMLGDGSSDNGSDKLDNMLDKVRVNKTGTKKQAQPINDKKMMAI